MVPTAVTFDEYGDVDVLRVVDVERPVPRSGDAQARRQGSHGSAACCA